MYVIYLLIDWIERIIADQMVFFKLFIIIIREMRKKKKDEVQ